MVDAEHSKLDSCEAHLSQEITHNFHRFDASSPIPIPSGYPSPWTARSQGCRHYVPGEGGEGREQNLSTRKRCRNTSTYGEPRHEHALGIDSHSRDGQHLARAAHDVTIVFGYVIGPVSDRPGARWTG